MIRTTTARIMFTCIFLALLAAAEAQTVVDLATDKDTLFIRENLNVTLYIHAEERITGQLTVINLDEKRQVAVLFQAIKPSCSCRPDTRVIGDYIGSEQYIPKEAGNYQVRAYFGQIEKTVNFTVVPEPIEETTSTIKPAPATSTTNPKSTTSTTTAPGSTSTTKPEATSITNPPDPSQDSGNLMPKRNITQGNDSQSIDQRSAKETLKLPVSPTLIFSAILAAAFLGYYMKNKKNP